MNANKSWDSIADRLSRILHYNNKSMTKTQYYQIDDSLEAIDTGDYKKAKDILFNIVHYHNKNLNKDVYFELDEILDDITALYSGLGESMKESWRRTNGKDQHYWLDADTFVYEIGEYTDEDGDEYFIRVEHQLDNDEFVFENIYSDDHFETPFSELSEKDREEIKEVMRTLEDNSMSYGLREDTIKQGNAWVNKGKEGTHGKFRTKKEADAQRKAMFAQGYKGEGMNESTSFSDRNLPNIETGSGDIYKATLLSVKEAEKLDHSARVYPRMWWLRSRGFSSGRATSVRSYGTVDPYGYRVFVGDFAVRPALTIKTLEPKNLELYSKVFINGWKFIKIGEDTFLYDDKPIPHYFNKTLVQGNDYETSDIRKFVETDFVDMVLNNGKSGGEFKKGSKTESLNESAYEDFMNEIRSTDEYHKVSKILERAYKALSNEEYKKVYAEAQKVKKEIMASHINESFEDRVAENDKISNVKDASDIGDWVSEGYVYTFDYKGDTYYVKITRDFNKWSISKLINKTKKTEYKFNKSNWGDKFFKDTFSIEFLRRDEDNWKPLSNTPSHRSDHLSDSLHTKHREGLKESSDYGVCKKCGKKLIPGENYYTMSTEKVCTDCGNKPDYSRLKPARKSVSGDYEDKILARQELELGESRQNNEFYRGEVIWNYGDEDTFEVGFEGKPREFPSKEDAKKAIDEYRKEPHYLSKYERDYYSGPEEGGYTSTGLILIDSKRYPDYDSAVRALEVKQADYTEDELEYVGNDIFEDSYGYVYNVEHDKGSEHSPAKSWAEAELGEDFVARQADEVLEGAVGNLSDKEVDKLLGTLRKAKKLLGVNRIEDIYYVQSEDDPEDWQRELEFSKENINSKVDFFNSKKYNISVVREQLDNGSVALYFADEDSVNRYHDITGNYYDDNFDYSV